MQKNIIVLMLDTARADAVYDRRASPNMARIASHSTVYRNAVSPGTWTAPSHAALFTNTDVSRISGVSRDFMSGASVDPWLVQTKFLDAGTKTLASRISAAGYLPALFSNNPFLSSSTNLGEGFERIYDIWRHSNVKYNKRLADIIARILARGRGTLEQIYDASYLISMALPRGVLDSIYLRLRLDMDRHVAKADGTSMLDRGANDTVCALRSYLNGPYNHMPHLFFINLIEAHENYPVGKPSIVQDKWLYLSGILEFDAMSAARLHNAYLRRIRYLDRKVAQLIDTMRAAGALDDAILVITADHGQLFGEHGLLYHAMFPYEPLAKVPLIAATYENGRLVHMPDDAQETVSLNALHGALLDVAAGRENRLNGNMHKRRYVRCEHMGISEGWDAALLSRLRRRSRYAEALYRAKKRHNIRASAVYHGSMKLIHYFGKRTDELYDLENDPQESDNVLYRERATAKLLLKRAA